MRGDEEEGNERGEERSRCSHYPPPAVTGVPVTAAGSGDLLNLQRVKTRISFHRSVYKVILHKSIPEQILQFILCNSNDKGQVDGIVRELSFVKRLRNHFL